MTKKPKIRAAGAVVLRGSGDDVEVLLIHRPAYGDWSLPKGKGRKDELAPQTAIREVFEETGVAARLGLRLPSIRYKLTKGLKKVDYWRAEVVTEQPFEPNREVDKIKWTGIDKAMRTLTYADERRLLSTALLKPRTTPLLLVRHGKAMLRKDWSGPDQERRLTSRGRRQAQELTQLFSAYGVETLVSSSSTRCVETLRPYAEQRGLEIDTKKVLTEEEGTVHPSEVEKFVAKLFRKIKAPHRTVRAPPRAAVNVRGPGDRGQADGGGRGRRRAPRRRRQPGRRRGPQTDGLTAGQGPKLDNRSPSVNPTRTDRLLDPPTFPRGTHSSHQG